MTKQSISLYEKNRTPMSLGNLELQCGKYVEDIFDAVEDSKDFDDLTQQLKTIIEDTLIVDRVTDRYIRYIVNDCWGQ